MAGARVRVSLHCPAASARWGSAVRRARARLAVGGPAAALLWLRARAAEISSLGAPGVRRVRRVAAAARWGAAWASCRDPPGIWRVCSPPSRAWVAKLPLHRGAAPCVHGGLLDMALCLSLVRSGAAVGDVVLCISASSPARPPGYVAAVASHGSRALWRCVAAFRVSRVLAPAAFFGGAAFRGRPSCVYRLLPEGSRAGVLGADGRRFALRPRARWHSQADLRTTAPLARAAWRRDLRGQVLLASAWRVWGSSLDGAPFLPPGLSAWVSARGSLRGGRLASAVAAGDACVFDFVRSLAVRV